LNDIPVIISNSGWSPENGYEILLLDNLKAEKLWKYIMQKGKKYNIKPSGPNQLRRIEGNMLSYGSDTLKDTNGLEINNSKYLINFDKDFLGKKSLEKIKNQTLRKYVKFELNSESDISKPPFFYGNSVDVYFKNNKVGKLVGIVKKNSSAEKKKYIGLVNLDENFIYVKKEFSFKFNNYDLYGKIIDSN